MVYISVINTQTLQVTFLHDIDLLWAASHVLHPESCNIRIQIRTIQLVVSTEKFSPLPGFEPRPFRYQANMLPIELSWLG